MDIRKAIAEEHSKAQCNRIVHYIGADKKRFEKLMQAFFEGDRRSMQRASWPLSCCVKEHPSLIVPYLGRLIGLLEDQTVHDAVKRNTTRLLAEVDIPKKYHGKVMNACFHFISDVKTAVAIKAFSLTLLDNLSRSYPEITRELNLLISERWPAETAAFRSRAKKILQRQSSR